MIKQDPPRLYFARFSSDAEIAKSNDTPAHDATSEGVMTDGRVPNQRHGQYPDPWKHLKAAVPNSTTTDLAQGIRTSALQSSPKPPSVPMRIYWDDPLQSPVEIDLPSSAVYWSGGRPIGLQGPRVAISLDDPLKLYVTGLPSMFMQKGDLDQEIEHSIEPVKPNTDGNFLLSPDGRALGQTTSFFAAHQVLTLVEQAAGRRIHWGESGRLEIKPYAVVGTAGTNLNAFFSHGSGSVSLGSFADIVDGDLHPYSGNGLDFFDDVIASARADLTRMEQLGAHAEIPDSYQLAISSQERTVNRLQRYGKLARVEGATAKSFMDAVRTDRENTIKSQPRSSDTSNVSNQLASSVGAMQDSDNEKNLIVAIVMILATTQEVTDELVELAKSREVSAHEAAHAALAALKPSLRTVTGQALHEAYSDLLSFYTALDRPQTVDAILAETGGDLTRSNSATRIGEQFVQAIARATKNPEDDSRHSLRDIANTMTVADFAGLTLDMVTAPRGENSITFRPHHLSKLISGTNHELFGRLANEKLAALGKNTTVEKRRAAVVAARDEASALLHQMLMFLPEDGGTLNDLVAAYLQADSSYSDGVNREPLLQVFGARGLMSGQDDLPQLASMQHVPEVFLRAKTTGRLLDTVLRSGEYQDVMARLRPKDDDGEFVLAEDITDEHGFRSVRLTWTRAPDPKPESFSDEAWAELQEHILRLARAQFGENIDNIMKPRGSLVFDPNGTLIAINGVDGRSTSARPASVLGCSALR